MFKYDLESKKHSSERHTKSSHHPLIPKNREWASLASKPCAWSLLLSKELSISSLYCREKPWVQPFICRRSRYWNANLTREGWYQRHGQSPPWQSPTTTRRLSSIPISWPTATQRWSLSPLTVPIGLHAIFFVFPTKKRAERKSSGVRGKHLKAFYNVKRNSSQWVSRYLPGHVSASVLVLEENILMDFKHLYWYDQ